MTRTLALLVCLLLGLVVCAQTPAVEIRPYQGRPTAFLDGVPVPLAGYSPRVWNRTLYPTQTARFFPDKLDVYLFNVPNGVDNDFYGTPFWGGDDVHEDPRGKLPSSRYETLDEPVDFLLKGDPHARVLIRMSHHEPRSWNRLHADQLFVTDEGKVLDCPSLASDLYWDAAARYCTALIRHYESRPWADRIIGYANFHRDEGVHEPVINGWLFDHSPVMTVRWRAWLQAKYGTEAALRAAYRDPTLTFATVTVPTDKLNGPQRAVSRLLYWQGAKDNAPLRDYLLLQRDLFHQRFRQIGAAMRAGTDRPRLFLHDAFKQTLLGWDIADFFQLDAPKALAEPEVMAGSGSMGVADLFDVPGMDGLITPHDYQARGVGGIFEPEGIADSAVLHGKLFYCEMDTRTFAHNYPRRDYGAARDLQEFSAVTWRNLATALTRGFWFYWMDLTDDWFAADAMRPVITRQVQVLKEAVHWPHATVPGIAVILDDSAVLETNGAGNYLNEAVMWEQKEGLARCGVPVRTYLLEDLALPNFPEHRVYYFPNLFKVDDARLKLLREKVFRNGHVVVWGPGSGISDGATIGPANAAKLTGFTFDMLPANFSHRVLVTNFDHPATRGLAADTILGSPLSYGPLLFPTDGTVLGGAWTKQNTVHSGLAVKEFGRGAGISTAKQPRGEGDWAGVFATAVPLPANLWRNLARWAGAHVYCETNDIVLADTSVVALHSIQSGQKTLALPGRYTVTDVITGKRLSRHARSITVSLQAPETRVFRIE
jgi:hypothetical protein